ncbi:MAG: elongation factor G [Planctomycetaceae bacterium]|nr:elongation factor G [Planctomycetaceae bacterium]
MSKYQTAQLRNIVLVGHGAAGKTTLADLMLFKAGVGTRAGSVDDGTSLLDIDEEERQRHFSISSAMIHFEHHHARINAIDTPGYPDFVGQAISALCAAETAVVVINAAAGIEANTRRTFDLAGKAHLARMIVINKLDHDNLDFPGLVEHIQETFGRNCVLMNVPLGLGPKFHGVVSTLKPTADHSDAVIDPATIGSAVMDAIVEADEELMERYLNGDELSAEAVLAGVSKAVAAGTLIPILCTCAKSGAGVPELMDAIADFALSPGELVRHGHRESGEEVDVGSSDEAPLIAQVFKTRIDPFVSKMSFIRVFSGKLTKDSTVRDLRTGKSVKVHQLLDVQGGQVESVDEAHAGDVVAVAKVDDFQVGDTLVNNGDGVLLPPIVFPSPMIGLAVEPKSRADQQKISGALHKIEEEDPTFRVTRDPQTHEMVMRGMSELHLQIVQNRLHARDKVDIVTHQPKVPYRETIMANAEGSYRHKKQSGGSGQFAEVHLRVYPLPHDIDPKEHFIKERYPGLRDYHYDANLNFAFLDCVSGGTVPNQYIPAVEKGVRERMEQGVLAGFPMQDLAVALFFGKDHPVDSNEAAFRTAASMCFRDVARQARPTLLEPMMHLEVTVPGDKLGDVSSDLNTRRGRMEGMDNGPAGAQVVKARAPLAELMTYARTLSSLSGGQGSYLVDFSHYEMVPPNEQQKVVAAAVHMKEEE